MHRLAGSHQQLACRRISPGLLHRICALSGRRAVSTGAAKGNKGKSSGLGHIDPEYRCSLEGPEPGSQLAVVSQGGVCRNEVANILERAESSLDAWEPTWTKYASLDCAVYCACVHVCVRACMRACMCACVAMCAAEHARQHCCRSRIHRLA